MLVEHVQKWQFCILQYNLKVVGCKCCERGEKHNTKKSYIQDTRRIHVHFVTNTTQYEKLL